MRRRRHGERAERQRSDEEKFLDHMVFNRNFVANRAGPKKAQNLTLPPLPSSFRYLQL
jgi:hypothetical protein